MTNTHRKSKPKSDFSISDHGSIYILVPNSIQAIAWCEDHMPNDAQIWFNGYVIEHRFIQDIINNLVEGGFTHE